MSNKTKSILYAVLSVLSFSVVAMVGFSIIDGGLRMVSPVAGLICALTAAQSGKYLALHFNERTNPTDNE
jgi:hypothetical protein